MKKHLLILFAILVVSTTRGEPPFLLIAGTEPNWDRNIAVINKYLSEPLGLSTNWRAIRQPIQWQSTTNARVKLNVTRFSLGAFTKGTNVVDQAWLDRMLSSIPVSREVIITVTNSMKILKDKGFEEPPAPQ